MFDSLNRPIESSKQYITNLQNGKRVLFRRQLLPFILILTLLGSAVYLQINELSLTVDQLVKYQDQQSQATTDVVESIRYQRDKIGAELLTTQSALDQKNKELTEVNSNLAAKLKELADKDNEVAELQKKIKNQESQISANSSELDRLRNRPPLFSFRNESSLANIETKKAEVRQIVTDAYDYIVEVYGQPYLLHSVTITFVDHYTIEGASGEITINNSSAGLELDIRLKDFDKNSLDDIVSITHEIIHSFHGFAIFNSTVFEEGITVAATDVVIKKLMDEGKINKFPSLYITTSWQTYDSWNKTLTIPKDIETFYRSEDVAKYYQMAGFSWRELYKADNDFFKKFNNLYYTYIQNGEVSTDQFVKSIIAQVVKTVNSQNIETYLADQKAFNPI